jgi:hypothetical protein
VACHGAAARAQVALKLLPADLTRDPVRIQGFEQEARAASALNHPNVCTIHVLDQTSDGQHYIAIEYVEGDTHRQRLVSSRLSLRTHRTLPFRCGGSRCSPRRRDRPPRHQTRERDAAAGRRCEGAGETMSRRGDRDEALRDQAMLGQALATPSGHDVRRAEKRILDRLWFFAGRSVVPRSAPRPRERIEVARGLGPVAKRLSPCPDQRGGAHSRRRAPSSTSSIRPVIPSTASGARPSIWIGRNCFHQGPYDRSA